MMGSLITLHVHIHGSDASFQRTVLSQLEKLIMANEAVKADLAEIEAKVDGLTVTLGKVSTETSASLAEIQTLEDIIAGLQNPDPELVAAVARVKAKVQAAADAAAGIDAQVPDAP
jgi:hypothetical protein